MKEYKYMENSFNRKDMEIFFVRHGESYGNVETEPKPQFKTIIRR